MAFLKAGQSGVIIDENGNKIVDENGNGFSIGSGKFILRANHKILAKPEGGGDDIPLTGTLAHQWDFNENNPNFATDKVGGVVATANHGFTFGNNGCVYIGYTSGICLNALIKENDYIECVFHFGNYSGNHVRPLNATKNISIDDMAAFIIWRGGYNYWASYMFGWTQSYSNNFNLFNGKRLGVYLKDGGKIDIYVDNLLIVQDYSMNWQTAIGLPHDKNFYALGVTTTNVTSSTPIECESVRIFRNCHY